MTANYNLDEDFAESLYERAMRDPGDIPQSLTAIAAVLKVVRAERERVDGTITHLEEIFASLQADRTTRRADAPRSSVVKPFTHGLTKGSKRHRVFMIVAQLTKAKKSATSSEIMAKMERRGLFKNISGNKREYTANILHELRKSRHLDSMSRGNWSLPNEAQLPTSGPAATPAVALPRRRGTRPGSKRDRCAKILKSLCQNETQSAKRSEIKQAWSESGVFDDVTDQESATSAMLTHLKNYGFITTDNRGTWTWITGLR